MADKTPVVLKFDDADKPAPKKPTLWERANTPVANLRGAEGSEMRKATEQLQKDHPILGGVSNALLDTASAMTSPTMLGLSAATAGGGTVAGLASKLGLNGVIPAAKLLMRAGEAGMVGHGGYKAITGETPYDKTAGLLELGMGGLGLASGGHSAPASAGPDLKTAEGLRVAMDNLRKNPGPIGPEELKIHQALDEYTLRNRKGPLSVDIYGKEGRPDLSVKNPTTGKLESRGISITDAEKAYNEGLKLTDADKRATQNSAATDISLQDAVEADRAKKATQHVKDIEAGFKASADANKGLAGAEATKAKVDAQGIAQEAKNLNARDKYLSGAKKVTDRETAAQMAQREKDAAQEARNLNARDKFQNKVGKDQVAAEAEDAKRADAAQQAQTLAALRENLTETVPPSSISETVSGPGENGGTARATIRRVAPEPPATPEPVEPAVHDVDYFKKIDAIRAAKDAGYDPKEWDIKGGRNKWNIIKRGAESEATVSTVPPTPDTAADGGALLLDPNTTTKRFRNGAQAAAVAKEAGMDVHKIGPRQYELRPKPTATPEPEVVPKSTQELLAPDPSEASSSSSLSGLAPDTSVTTIDKMRGYLNPDEFRRYMDIRPTQGISRTPAETAEYLDLSQKMRTDPEAQAVPVDDFVAPTGEAEPTLPGVAPTVNPASAPVTDVPFSLDGGKSDRFSETSSGSDALGSLFDDIHGEGNLPEGLNPQGHGTMPAPAVEPAPAAPIVGFAPKPTLEGAQAEYGNIKAAKEGGAFIPDEVRSSAGEELQALEKGAKPTGSSYAAKNMKSGDLSPEQLQNGRDYAQSLRAEGKIDLARKVEFRISQYEAQSEPVAEPAPVETAPSTPDSAIAELQAHIDDPQTSPTEKTLLQRLQDNLKSKGIMLGGDPANKGQGSTLSMFGAGQGPNIRGAFANNGLDPEVIGGAVLKGANKIAPALEKAGSFMNDLHRSTLLSPYSVGKKGAGDVMALGTAGLDKPSAIPSLVKNSFHPETLEDFKSGYGAPTHGEEENTGLQNIFSSKLNPLGVAGRTMSGMTRATKGILERSGFTPEEAQAYTLTKTPSRALTSKMYETLNLPGMNYVSPFPRIALNWVEQGYERSPLGLIDLLIKRGELSGGEAATIMKKAATGTAAGAAAYALTPEDFVKEHPILSRTMTAGPMGPAILAGMLLKSSGKHPINDTAAKLLEEMPGMKLAEDAQHPSQMLRSHLASYTNVVRPIAEAMDPDPRETSKDLEGLDYYTAPMQANIPRNPLGIPNRSSLPIKAEKKTPVKLVF